MGSNPIRESDGVAGDLNVIGKNIQLRCIFGEDCSLRDTALFFKLSAPFVISCCQGVDVVDSKSVLFLFFYV